MSAAGDGAEAAQPVCAALAALGIERFLLGLPDRSFPVAPARDTGSGTPYGRDGTRLLAVARSLGFDGIQLGPQGETSPGNPSPYDGTTFSRGVVALAMESLAEPELGALLAPARIEALVAARPAGPADRVSYRFAHAAHTGALREAFAVLRRRVARGDSAAVAIARRVERFGVDAADWLERDALYRVLEERHGGAVFRDWPDPLDRRLFAPVPGEEAAALARRRALEAGDAEAIGFHGFVQWVAHEQHERLRAHARAIGIRLYGDVPIGLSSCDEWGRRDLVLESHRLGAPPSRTNPAGQPWGYPVLDPGRTEAVRTAVRARFDALFARYDGLRIDHPHGYVDPWVYDAADPDPLHAVRNGARLRSSPDLPDHPALARFAIARPDQLRREPPTPRHADGWVRSLERGQVERYGALFEEIVAAAHACGAASADLVCEVLSTLPYPLARVLERHGLGRFRVTQKADPRNRDDVYRSENARPEDWILLGNHDTPTIWALVEQWPDDVVRARAAQLGARLAPAPGRREALAARLASDRGLLVQALAAELFVGPARHVMLFFSDLFGLRAPYNQPGEISAENWTLRLTEADVAELPARAAAGRAIDLPFALVLALRARGAGSSSRHTGLIDALEARVPSDRLRSVV